MQLNTDIIKKITFILLLYCVQVFLQAQNPVADSIQIEIANAKDDTTRYKAINHLARIIYSNNPDSAYQMLAEILPFAEEINNVPLIMELYYTQGLIYAEREQYDSAVIIFEAAREMAVEIGDNPNLAHILDQIGHAYFYQSQTTLGIKYLKKALALAEDIGDKNIELKEANNLGRIYSFLSRHDSADILLNRAYGIQVSLGNKRLQAEILVNLGFNAIRTQQYEKSVSYLERALDIFQELNDDLRTSITYGAFGVCYNLKGDLPKCLEYFHKSLETIEGTEYHSQIISAMEDLSEAYSTIEDYDNALLYLEKAAEEREKAFGQKTNSESSFRMGKLLILKNEYDKALGLFLESMHLKKEAGQFVDGDLYWNIGQSYEMLSRSDSAIFYYELAKEIKIGPKHLLVKSKSFAGLGRIYESRGATEKAFDAFQQAYNAAEGYGSEKEELDAAEGLYRTYKKQNNSSKALHFLEIARTIQDTLYNEKNVKKIAHMEAGFEFEKEKQELAFRQEKENEKQQDIRLFMGLTIAVLGLLIFIGVLYYRTKQKAAQQLGKLNDALHNQKDIVEKQKEKLEELDKAKSHFFTNISHEFRTPLTIISGMVDQVKTKPEIWLDKGTQMIKQNTVGLLNLVNQILDLRKLESSSLQLNLIQGDIIPYLNYIIESYRSFAQSKSIQLHFLTEVESVKMDYDPDKLLRIISNLLSNAVKYTPDGGSIYFQLDKKFDKPAKHESVLIRIKDTGAGIPEDQLPNIFDRFYQVEDSITRTGVGTGIGLALIQELVKLLNGNIQVTSEVDKGTTFLISLPITNESLVQEAINPFQLGSIGPLKESLTEDPVIMDDGYAVDSSLPCLLIVEDNNDIVQFLVACLEDDYQLQIARNGQEGIDKAIELVPDLIVSDVMMPEKDGFELCDILKNDELTSHIPIILLTAKADMESKISGLKSGADAYLTKPFEPEELLIRLEKLFELRKTLQQRYASEIIESSDDLKIEDEFIQKVRTILNENMENEDFGTVALCQKLRLSRTQVHNKIKALTDKSTSLFIRSIRLNRAKKLLQTTELNISEVGYQVGFSNPAYFSRIFTEEFGVPPARTRK